MTYYKRNQENNLIIFCKYLENNKYTQLKLQDGQITRSWIYILIFNDIYLYGKIFLNIKSHYKLILTICDQFY